MCPLRGLFQPQPFCEDIWQLEVKRNSSDNLQVLILVTGGRRWGLENILHKNQRKWSYKIWLPRNIDMIILVFSSAAYNAMFYVCEVRLRILECYCSLTFSPKQLFRELKCSVTDILGFLQGLRWAMSPEDSVFITSPFGIFHPSIRCSTDDPGKKKFIKPPQDHLMNISLHENQVLCDLLKSQMNYFMVWPSLNKEIIFLDYFPGL